MRVFVLSLVAVLALLTGAYMRANIKLHHVEFNTPRIVAPLPPEPPRPTQARVTVRDAEKLCLAQVVYYEARGEPVEGQVAVAEVVVNRAQSDAYPSSLCAVAYQPGQFALTIEDALPSPQGAAWKRAQRVAAGVLAGRLESPLEGRPTHFHAVSVDPYWAQVYRPVGQVGAHVFYERDI